MYQKHHTKGLVLGGMESGVDSRAVCLLTLDFGLVWARAQAGRRSYSKMRGGIQDFSLGDFSLVHGKGGWRLTSSRPEKNFYQNIKSSQEKTRVASSVVSLLRRLVSGEDPNVELFQTVVGFLSFLETAEDENIFSAECLALLKILHALGFLRHDPEFIQDVPTFEINAETVKLFASKKARMAELINESLKAAEAIS